MKLVLGYSVIQFIPVHSKPEQQYYFAVFAATALIIQPVHFQRSVLIKLLKINS